MLTQMVDLLIQQDPTLLAQRTVDARRYIMDQWDRTHRDPIDENALAVFLCDEAHSSLPEEQKIFAREKGAEVRDCYRNALFRLLLCGECCDAAWSPERRSTAECFCPRQSVCLTEAFPHAAACDELCSTRWGWVESQPQPGLQREFEPFLRALRRTKEKAG